MPQESAIHLWLILNRAARSVERNAQNSIAKLDLGLSDFAVLELLLHKGPRPVNQIGEKVLLTSGSITSAIDRLASRALVRRAPNPIDQRSRLVELTPAGRKLITQAFAQHTRDIEETMSILRPQERQDLARLLKKLGLWAAARAQPS
ncbi:MAG: MarR family transcriptional regulator [Acidobacteriota bacterium]